MSYQVVSTSAGNGNPAAPATFVDLTKNMEQELEKRRQDWEKEVTKMQQDFFKVKVTEPKKDPREGQNRTVELLHDVNVPRRGTSGTEIFDISHAKTLYSDNPDGSKQFKLRFDVKGYEPHEIKIKAEGSKLHVKAQTAVQESSGNTAVKQFDRQVDIPKKVDPDKLVSFLSADGILSVEAPVEPGDDEDEEGEELVDGGGTQVVQISPGPGGTYIMETSPGVNMQLAQGGTGGENVHMSSHMVGMAPTLIEPPSYQSAMSANVRSTSPTTRDVYTHRHVGGTTHRVVGGAPPILYTGTQSSHGIPDTGISYNVTRVHSGPVHHCHAGTTRNPMTTSPHKKGGIRRTHSPCGGTTVVEYSNKPSSVTRFGHGSSLGAPLTGVALSSHLDQFRYNDPTILSSEYGRRMKMVVDMGRDYTNEDVHVTIDGKKIEVRARKEQSVGGRTSKREFAREFFSPEDIDGGTARAVLGEDGKLSIGACVLDNDSQSGVVQEVAADMPSHGRSVHLHLQ